MGRFMHELGDMLTPSRYESKIRLYLVQCGYSSVPFELFGKSFMLSVVFTLIVYAFFVLPILAKNFMAILLIIMAVISWIAMQAAFTIFAAMSLYVYFELLKFKRTAGIEEVLPDFLEEVSVNLRAGMSFDKALWNSVHEEYGILEKEIEIVAKKVMSGEDTEQALLEFAAKYNSPLLRESMDLIIIGLKSGGEISDLIDRVVENVKQSSYLKRELIANITSYIIFISIIAVVISPALFALSYNLMMIMQGLGEKLASSGSSSMISFTFGADTIDPADFIAFSRWCIVIISVASSMIIADLREGDIKGGVKYIFIFIIVSFMVYELTLNVFNAIFGSLT
jgi:pilus assembly protein TadC